CDPILECAKWYGVANRSGKCQAVLKTLCATVCGNNNVIAPFSCYRACRVSVCGAI
uniref:ShKT domain-containing protein n=1 Tax=Anopheles coluzzii TaxID=1518534 RepID=A0A6E8W3Y0_ANOCL